MSKIDEVKEFSNMTKKIFEDFVEIGSKKMKYIWLDNNNATFDGNKGYEEESDIVKISDKPSNLKGKTDLNQQTSSIRKKDIVNEQISLDLDFSEENIMQAIVYSEIFGKPKAKRRRR